MKKLNNIINNSVRESGELNFGKWDIPITSANDVSLAIKCTRKYASNDFKKTLNALMLTGMERKWVSYSDLVEISEKTGSPVRYLRESVSRLNSWLSILDMYLNKFDKPEHSESVSAGIILAGDEISLAPWAITHALLANANAIIKPSSSEPLSACLFVKSLLEKGISVPNLLYINGSSEDGKDSVRKIISSVERSVVFGEDATINLVYDNLKLSPSHKSIKYWSGRSGAIILEDADLEKAAFGIIKGATEDRGNRCISTKKVFAPFSFAGRLEPLLIKYAEGLCRGDVTDERVELGQLDENARQLALSRAATGTIIYDNGLIIARCDKSSQLITEEVPYPALGLCYYSENDPVKLANNSVSHAQTRKALMMSVFTSDMQKFNQAASRLASYKAMMSLPTTYMDFNKMHQGMHLFNELRECKEFCL